MISVQTISPRPQFNHFSRDTVPLSKLETVRFNKKFLSYKIKAMTKFIKYTNFQTFFHSWAQLTSNLASANR